jgi:integrase
MVWLSTDGSPVVRWDHVLVRAASAARAIAPRFPHVTAHMLRHTFAVRTLRWLTSTQIRALIGIQGVFGDDLDPALAEALRRQDPLLVLRDLLGHRSVTTTEVYLQFIDPTRLFAVADIEESL